MSGPSGGAFLPDADYVITGSWTFQTPPLMAGFDRLVKTVVVPITGAAIHTATRVLAWQNPEPRSILVVRFMLDVTIVAAQPCTLNIGLTATSATTASSTLLTGIDVAMAPRLFDSQDPALSAGANAHAQKLAAGKWITVDEATGDATGLVATAYINYVQA